MKPRDRAHANGIIHPTTPPVFPRSNVRVCSNVYERLEGIEPPQEDVAFRCRVRGATALRDLVPPGLMNVVNNTNDIRVLPEADRADAMAGNSAHRAFVLLEEQLGELKAFRCIHCGRSTVSVWHDGRRVSRKFATSCICERMVAGEASL